MDSVPVQFFKALGNETRLKIVGILLNRNCTVTELAQTLGLKETAIVEHLRRLEAIELVREHGGAYSFDAKALHQMNKTYFSSVEAALVGDAPTWEDEWETLKRFFDGKRVKQLPGQRKKFDLLIKWLATQFEMGRMYAEKDVNEIIKQFHDDYTTLRRELIDQLYMRRERGVYWRVSEEERASILAG